MCATLLESSMSLASHVFACLFSPKQNRRHHRVDETKGGQAWEDEKLSTSTQQYQAHHGQRALGPGVLFQISKSLRGDAVERGGERRKDTFPVVTVGNVVTVILTALAVILASFPVVLAIAFAVIGAAGAVARTVAVTAIMVTVTAVGIAVTAVVVAVGAVVPFVTIVSARRVVASTAAARGGRAATAGRSAITATLTGGITARIAARFTAGSRVEAPRSGGRSASPLNIG